MIEQLLRLLFISMVENAFLFMFVLIRCKYSDKLLTVKNASVVFLASVLSLIFDSTGGLMYALDRVVLIMMFSLMLILFYEHPTVRAKDILFSFLGGLVIMFIIEGIVLTPLVAFLSLDMQAMQNNTYQLLLISIPARFFEYLFIYIYAYKYGRIKK